MSSAAATPITAIEETVHGLFGAAQCGDGTTIWCRGKMVLERMCDGSGSNWRPMTMDDVDRLLASGAIDDGAHARMEVRLMQ